MPCTFYYARGEMMKRLVQIIASIIFMALILPGIPGRSFASTLDFGWASPFVMTQRSKNGNINMAWPIQIINDTRRRLIPSLEIVAVMDNGRQYYPTPQIRAKGGGSSEECVSLSSLQTALFPSVSQRAIVVFEDLDPKASMVDFYVGGLETGGPMDLKEKVYLKITYRRSSSGWELEGISSLE